MKNKLNKKTATKNKEGVDLPPKQEEKPSSIKEVGGRGGLDPARFGDWEINGKCVDF